MNFFKALLPGTLLNLVVAGIIGSNHSTGGWLLIEHIRIQEYSFYWSWPLFLAATILFWIIMEIMPD